MTPGGARRTWVVGAALCACTLVVYWPLHGAAFLNYDDPLYVTANPEVQRGLTAHGLAWALTTDETGTWHPLTWVSHMLVVSVAGLRPGWHHLASVALHTANALLVLVVLTRATGTLWPSALVAFLFALHPLHVESVAWIAERKDVLSTLFGLLAIHAYVGYARDPRRRRVVAVALWLAASLMAKPTLVTLPVLLLLLDWWPLGRIALGAAPAARVRALVVEKLPLAALAAGCAAVTIAAQHHRASVTAVDTLPVGVRLAHALTSTVWYLGRALWPTRLAVFYPYPHTIDPGRVAAAAACLVALTAFAAALARRAPFVLVGWLWFLVSLLPVIGLVQVGMQSTADRYMYVPLVGLAIALAWSLAALARAAPRGGAAAAVALAAVAVAGCAATTARQLTYWMDDVALYRHALAVTSDNFVAHNNLGLALLAGGAANRAAAMRHFSEAVRIRPAYPEAHNNLGGVLYLEGRRAQAIAEFRAALRFQPDFTAAQTNLRIAEAPSAGAPSMPAGP